MELSTEQSMTILVRIDERLKNNDFIRPVESVKNDSKNEEVIGQMTLYEKAVFSEIMHIAENINNGHGQRKERILQRMKLKFLETLFWSTLFNRLEINGKIGVRNDWSIVLIKKSPSFLSKIFKRKKKASA